MDRQRKRPNRANKRVHRPEFDRKNQPNKKQFRHYDQLTEAEVGISEYTSSLEGFSGVLKARFSDFHVSEVDPNGTIAVLNSTDIPKDEEVIIVDHDSIENTPIETIPQNVWDDIRETAKTGSVEPVKFDINSLSKDQRKQVHSKIKSVFGSKLDSNTVEEDGCKYIVIKNRVPGDKPRVTWPDGWGQYVHFILYKEAMDTMTACYKVADVVKIKPALISYAGIKDKRAKTSQWMCIKQILPWKLMTKTKVFNNMRIGNIIFKDKPLRLGDLSGNRFKVVIRNVLAKNDVIERAIESVKDNGFINYFGLQRFGNDKEVPTYKIGVKLLLAEWREACRLILKPKNSDLPLCEVSNAKKIYYETSNAEMALNCLNRSRNNCVEAKLLQGLSREGNNYVNALASIPRNMRLLYLHAFQSYIWNKMVSLRIKKYGLKPMVNDFVLVEESDSAAESVSEETSTSVKTASPNSEEILLDTKEASKNSKESLKSASPMQKDSSIVETLANVEAAVSAEEASANGEAAPVNAVEASASTEEASVNVEVSENVEDETSEIAEEAVDLEGQKFRQQVRALTEEDLSNYTIFDVVLPLPGFDISYPENLKQEYKEELEKLGLTLEMPQQSVKTYTLPGGYRKILGKVQDVQWKTMKYNNPETSLIMSDLDVLRKLKAPEDIPDGKFKAVILEFTLEPSVYATMALREIMKADTSPSAQVKMNDYAGKQEPISRNLSCRRGMETTVQPMKVVSEEPVTIRTGLLHNSILNDKEKMEEFKRQIYGDKIKRKSETSDEGDSLKKPKMDN